MGVSFPSAVAVGCALGFLSGLGIGGGSLLILFLTLIAHMDASTARCINLLFFIPCALCSSLFRLRQKQLPLKKLLLPIAAGCITAAVASRFGAWLDTQILKKIFGILLLATGLRELCYRKKGASGH